MSEPTEREWLEGLRYEDKFPEAGDGGRVPDVSEQRAETWEVVVCNTCNVVLGRDGERVDRRPTTMCSHLNTSAFVRAVVPDVSEQRAEAIGAYLAQYPPSGFTERYSAAGWSHIARGVLSAAAVFAAEARDPASVLAALLAESPGATVAAIEALLTSDEAERGAGDYFAVAKAPTIEGILSAACRALLSKAPKEDGDA